MQRALTLYQTSIGKKVVMAASAVIIVGFAVGHMAGNLQAYAGAEQYNAYAEMLKANAALLWGTRIALLFAFGFLLALDGNKQRAIPNMARIVIHFMDRRVALQPDGLRF